MLFQVTLELRPLAGSVCGDHTRSLATSSPFRWGPDCAAPSDSREVTNTAQQQHTRRVQGLSSGLMQPLCVQSSGDGTQYSMFIALWGEADTLLFLV